MRELPCAPRLMLVTDGQRSRWPLLDLVAAAVSGGVDAIYLRDAALPAAALAVLANDLRERIGASRDEGAARRAPATCRLVINGAPVTAREAGIGLHLREVDMPLAEARSLLGPDAIIGKSVHDAAGASRAAGADYVLAGHVFPSRSKPDLPPLGLPGLAAIVVAAPCPTLAIGGITPDRVAEVVRAGAHGVAVIGAIAEADDPRAAAAALAATLDDALRIQKKESGMNDAPSPTRAEAAVEFVVNGKPAIMPAGTTIHDFLSSKKMTDAMAIVERNGAIVPRAEYDATKLAAGDRLEVVHAVGGG